MWFGNIPRQVKSSWGMLYLQCHAARLLLHNFIADCLVSVTRCTQRDCPQARKHDRCGACRVTRLSSVRCVMRRLRPPSGCDCIAFLKCCCCTSSASNTQAPPVRSSPTMSPSQSRCVQTRACLSCQLACAPYHMVICHIWLVLAFVPMVITLPIQEYSLQVFQPMLGTSLSSL